MSDVATGQQLSSEDGLLDATFLADVDHVRDVELVFRPGAVAVLELLEDGDLGVRGVHVDLGHRDELLAALDERPDVLFELAAQPPRQETVGGFNG